VKKRIDEEGLTGAQVHTVDSIQGTEADVVVLSIAASDIKSEKFIANKNRLNVALSRAVHKVVIFGNSKIFESILVYAEINEFAKSAIP